MSARHTSIEAGGWLKSHVHVLHRQGDLRMTQYYYCRLDVLVGAGTRQLIRARIVGN